MLAGLGAGMSEAIVAVTPSETIKQVYSPHFPPPPPPPPPCLEENIILDLVMETGGKADR